MVKKVICLVLISVLLFSFGSCTPAEKQPVPLSADDVAQVTGSTAVYSSYLYVIEDRSAIAELTALYNGLRFRELKSGEEAPEDLLLGKMYTLMFYGADGKVIADCSLSPEGYVRFRDTFDTTYVLTDGFDEDKLVTLLRDHDIFK